MNKERIIALKKAYELNKVSLSAAFELACEDAYAIRYCHVSPIAQCRIRAGHLAFPFAAMWLDLVELVEKVKR